MREADDKVGGEDETARSDDNEAPKEASPRVLISRRELLSRPKSILRKTAGAAAASSPPSAPPPDSPTDSGHTQKQDSNQLCCIIV